MRKILFVFLLFVCVDCYGLQLSTIRTAVRNRVGDPSTDTSKQRWSDTEINFVINEGQREICEVTWALYTSTTIALVSGTTYYTMPSDHHFIDRVVYNGSTILPKKTIPLLDRETSTWLDTADAAPTSYFLNFERTKIGMYPVPNNTNNIEIWYVKVPTDLSADADIPFNTVYKYYPYHHLLIYYAASVLFMEDSLLEQYQICDMKYKEGLSRMIRQIGYTKKYIPKQERGGVE